MSSESPAAVLFDILGNTVAVYNNTAGVAGQPLLPVAGYDGYNNVTRYLLTDAQGSLEVTQASNNVTVLSNATVTTAGSDIYTLQYFGVQQINLIVNATSNPTGTGTPTLTFTIQEVDPGNGTTTFGSSASTTGITASGVYTAVLTNTHSSAVKVSWTISGTTPSFAGVYVTITTKTTPDTQVVSGTVTATNSSVGTDGAAALGFDTQVGGKVTTAAPTYTTGNLNALSLTTLGGLRIDGVYAAGTANATAADLMNSGGYVTTAAPTYTTGQLEPISLNTAGGVRIDGVSATGATTGSTAMLTGGAVTTSAPTYTTGQMDPLSLTTAGLLRIDGVYPVNATTPTTDATFVAGAVTTAAPTYTTGQMSALSLDTSGNLRVLVGNTTLAVTQSTSPWIVAGGGTAGSAATGVVTVQGITGMTPIVTLNAKATTSTFTTVAGATSSTSILAANTNRVAASIYNNTNKNMYILCNSGTASASNFSILLMQGSYWEVPSDYQGAINAIWASGVSGNANVTEYTP